ncbi:MAG: tRNA pseudouridine(55) synthase TruB [Acidimicrobiia bacterium]
MLDGLLVVDKPAGFTSHDVVARIRRIVAQKKVGHAGTLDPDATGVLLVGLGRVTRLLRFLQAESKEYRGTVVFGTATDTLDASGRVVARREMTIDREEIGRAVEALTGDIEQVPPMVSAVQVGGRRLHAIAREGREVDRPARPVTVHRFDIVDLDPGPPPVADIEVECGSGTYVRSLAADLGAALGGPAHLGSLRRTRVGEFTLDDAVTLDTIAADPRASLRPPVDALRHLPRVVVDADGAAHVAVGRPLAVGEWQGTPGDGPVAVLDDCGLLIAVYDVEGDTLRPSVVLK